MALLNMSTLSKIQDHGLSLLQMPYRLIAHPPVVKFLIFGRGRSGSTLLYRLLNQHPEINCQGELLHHYSRFPKWRIRYFESRNRRTAFGFKLLTYQCTDVYKMQDVGAFLRYFQERGYRLIYLERTNLAHQAISNISAFQNQQFQQTAKAEQIYIDPEKLLMWLDILSRRKKIEQDALQDIPYLHLLFETQLAQSEQHQSTIDQVSAYLGLPPASIDSPNSKILVKPLSEYLENYDALQRTLIGTPFEGQLTN